MDIVNQLFGPGHETVWRQLCTETGARFIESDGNTGPQVEITRGPWTIMLNQKMNVPLVGSGYTITTRLHSSYAAWDGFEFSVYRSGLLTGLATRLGMQDVVVGHEEFDRDFMIQGSDSVKLRTLFADANVRALMTSQPDGHLAITKRDGEAVNGDSTGGELTFTIGREVKDLERLKGAVELMFATLDALKTL